MPAHRALHRRGRGRGEADRGRHGGAGGTVPGTMPIDCFLLYLSMFWIEGRRPDWVRQGPQHALSTPTTPSSSSSAPRNQRLTVRPPVNSSSKQSSNV